MAGYEYKIGADHAHLAYVSALTETMCRGEFIRWPKRYTGANGTQYGDGLPKAIWHFDWISQTDLNTLRTYWITGTTYQVSKAMAIKTRDDAGSFSVFNCVGHWPEDIESRRVMGNFYQDVEIEFTQLVVVAT